MTDSCRSWRGALGAWALGDLHGGEADALVAHLATCDACRDEAGRLTDTAAALGSVPDAPQQSETLQPPPQLVDHIAARLAAERASQRSAHRLAGRVAGRVAGRGDVGRRSLMAAAAVVVFAVVAVAALAWWPSGDDEPALVPVALTEAADGFDGSVEVEAKQWGTLVHIEAAGFQAGESYAVWVEDREGGRHAAGTFLGIDGRLACYMAAATPFPEAAIVGIDTADGVPVIRGELPGPETAFAP